MSATSHKQEAKPHVDQSCPNGCDNGLIRETLKHETFGYEYDAVRECECRKFERQQKAIDKALKMSRIPEDFKDATIESYEPKYQPAAFKAVNKYIEMGFYKTDGLYMSGPVGTGKTHLGIGIIKELQKRGVACAYANLVSLMDSLRQFGRDTSLGDIQKHVLDTPVLFLDDLGAERTTDWTTERLYLIVNERMNNCLPTIFASNYDIGRIGQFIGDVSGQRIVDRILKICGDCFVEFKGESYRMLKR